MQGSSSSFQSHDLPLCVFVYRSRAKIWKERKKEILELVTTLLCLYCAKKYNGIMVAYVGQRSHSFLPSFLETCPFFITKLSLDLAFKIKINYNVDGKGTVRQRARADDE